jgi:transcriptional regulator
VCPIDLHREAAALQAMEEQEAAYFLGANRENISIVEKSAA